MNARQGSAPMTLVLAAGQVQRVLVEAGSMIMVTQGALTVRFPFAWLAENVVACETQVRADEARCLEQGGWIDLVASGSVEALLLPPDGVGLWTRVGQRVGQMLREAQASVRQPQQRSPSQQPERSQLPQQLGPSGC
ncbi:MAG: hypothetical protein HYU78_10485 [Rhodocyclales bacterium]|nr:hypothetical protein [Rhodocyclales bacterium]